MSNSKDLQAGVIGLGMIGGGVAVSLVNKERTPAVFDIIAGAADRYKVLPRQLESPAAVSAESDVIMIAVFNYEQCKEVITGENGLLKNAREGMVFVILSTIALAEVKELYEICKDRGVGVLDCGVTPGDQAGKNGLVAMVGGDKEVYDHAKPVLDDWAGASFYCGPSGAGMACKIARNMNTYGVWRITAESFRLALAAGVDPKMYLEVLETADKIEPLFYLMTRFRVNMPSNKLEGLENVSEYMDKDLKASKRLSDSLGLVLPTRDHLMGLCLDTFDCGCKEEG